MTLYQSSDSFPSLPSSPPSLPSYYLSIDFDHLGSVSTLNINALCEKGAHQ